MGLRHCKVFQVHKIHSTKESVDLVCCNSMSKVCPAPTLSALI
ncbi:hypothetical protein ACKS0A_12199 [Histoplasma ohiense]